ncbi:MAG: hypothetical protein IPP71_09200 [Bacteroidetes bacterium]|nr:hypothetical protein [Bacteroidota bacterium]
MKIIPLHDITDYFDAQTPTQTITFSIAMDDPGFVLTDGGVPMTGYSVLRGLRVWVDDVYLKKFDNPGNLISDGDVEGATSGMSDEPKTDCIWYFKNLTSFIDPFNTCTTLDDSNNPPTILAKTEAYLTSVDRKSGSRAIELKLPGIHYSSCTSYDFITPLDPITPDDGEVISVAVDFDYRDFLGCDDLTTNLTGTNLFVSFPDEPYSDSNGDPITLTDGKFYIDRDITLSSNNSLNNPDNLIIEGAR